VCRPIVFIRVVLSLLSSVRGMNNRILIIALVVLVSACGKDSPTSPSDSTSTTPTVAAASISETWNSTIAVGSSRFYSFTVGENGTVNVTLSAVSGDYVPATVTLGLGIGQPSGTECTTSTTASVSTQTTAPQMTGTYAPGVYCVRVWDVGNLFAPASFSVIVAHP
jgi:hypothetical protein